MREVARRRGSVAGIRETYRKSPQPRARSSSSPHLQRSGSFSKPTSLSFSSLWFLNLSVANHPQVKFAWWIGLL